MPNVALWSWDGAMGGPLVISIIAFSSLTMPFARDSIPRSLKTPLFDRIGHLFLASPFSCFPCDFSHII